MEASSSSRIVGDLLGDLVEAAPALAPPAPGLGINSSCSMLEKTSYCSKIGKAPTFLRLRGRFLILQDRGRIDLLWDWSKAFSVLRLEHSFFRNWGWLIGLPD